MRILELCAGTGSIGKAFRELGFEVISLDLMPDFSPTIEADLMTWDYRVFPPGHFDVCWCSPPCTEYSRAKTIGVRKLEQADALVARMREIFDYFRPAIWAFENPHTGLLKSRAVVAGLPHKVVTYCQYGFPYRKATAIWTNLDSWQPRPVCTPRAPCQFFADGRHPKTAQRGPTRGNQRKDDHFSQNELYSMPPELCLEFAQACVHFLTNPNGAM